MNEERNPKLDRFINIIGSFNVSLKDIKRFTSHLSPVIEKVEKEDQENFLKAIVSAYKKIGVDTKKLEGGKIVLTDEQKKEIYKNLELPQKKSFNSDNHLWKSNFVLLISSFEFLFADIINFYFKFYPTSALDKNFELNLKDIYEYKTIEEFVDEIVSKKIESLLYRSFEDQIIYLKKELKLNIYDAIIEWDLIKEATLRRNLIVHNNSKINNRYLTEVNREYCKDVKKLEENSKITISKEYFERVYEEFYLAGHIILQSCFRKWLSDFSEIADALLMDYSYRCLNENENISAQKICQLGKQICSTNNDFQFRNNVNFCISLKNQNKQNELQKELDSMDISNLSPILVMAYFALCDDKENTIKQIKNAKTVDKLKFEDINEWPLFSNLRKDEDFIQKTKKIFRIKE